jgi:hypothetical protein
VGDYAIPADAVRYSLARRPQVQRVPLLKTPCQAI